jgi:hypothetical protein
MNEANEILKALTSEEGLWLVIFTIGLFWSLMWTATSKRFGILYQSLNADGKPNLKSVLGAFILLAFTTFSGAIAIAKKDVPDLPWAAISIAGLLLSIQSVERIFAMKMGQPLPPDTTKVTTESTVTTTGPLQ